LPKRVSELTGITDDDVATGGVHPVEALTRFLTFIGPSATLFVAHNASFDAAHLMNEFRTTRIDPPSDVAWFDSMRAFQYCYPAADRSRLADMARTVLGAQGFVTSHRAVADARVVRDAMAVMSSGDVPGFVASVEAATCWSART
jgi:DNA polymerase III epsilon subunit-like protein